MWVQRTGPVAHGRNQDGRRPRARLPRRAGRSDARRILITDGDNVGVLAAARGLAAVGYEPWVAVTTEHAPAARSRAVAGTVRVPAPAHDVQAFVAEIGELIESLRPLVVMPGAEAGMIALAEARAALPDSAQLAVCEPDTVMRATDKVAVTHLAREVGIATPRTAVMAADRVEADLRAELPVIVKPSRSRFKTATGFQDASVAVAYSRRDLVSALARLPEGQGVVQPYREGSLTSLAGVFWAGEILGSVHQRSIRTWPTGCGEMAYAVARTRDSDLEASVAPLLAALNWSGLFQVQFLETEEERLLLDLNPRIYGSLGLALAANQNLPALWVDLLLGRRVTVGDYRHDVSFRNEILVVLSRLLGPPSREHRTLGAVERVHRAAYAFFDRRDPLPALEVGPLLAAKLARRRRNASPPAPAAAPPV